MVSLWPGQELGSKKFFIFSVTLAGRASTPSSENCPKAEVTCEWSEFIILKSINVPAAETQRRTDKLFAHGVLYRTPSRRQSHVLGESAVAEGRYNGVRVAAAGWRLQSVADVAAVVFLQTALVIGRLGAVFPREDGGGVGKLDEKYLEPGVRILGAQGKAIVASRA